MPEHSSRSSAPIFDQLERVLPKVSKPVQYIGGELNAAGKDWDEAKVRWALMYPDAYEVGLPNQGVQILYEVLNEAEGVLAQRSYSVWPDLENLMRERGIPAYGAGLLSDKVPLSEFLSRFHGNNERIDVDSLRLTTKLFLDVFDRLWR